MSKNILLLGGTGAMGTHLVDILSSGGVMCHVTSRSKRENRENVTYIQGDAHQVTFMNPLLASCHWDAIIDFMIYSTDEFRSKIQAFLASTSQYVYISSARVYAESDIPLTEKSPRLLDVCTDQEYLSTDEYALCKARQENILSESGKYNWTIVRPYITFSETRLQLSLAEKEAWLYRALKGKTIFFSRDLAQRYTTLTYGYDVAQGIAALLGKDEAMGEAFHITASENHRWSEILENYLAVIERRTGARPPVKMLDQWNPIVGGGYTQYKWDRLYNRRFDNSKIAHFVDVSKFKPTIPTISACLNSFIDHPQFANINWDYEAVKDRRAGEWTNLLQINRARQKLKYILVRGGLLYRKL